MTIEEAKRRAELYSAVANGKTIQVLISSGEWKDVNINELTCISENISFRIKAEPKYRPFKTKEECWSEMLKHQPFGWVKEISSGILYLINSILDSGIAIMEDVDIFEEAINSYEFKDGTPFGIKDE